MAERLLRPGRGPSAGEALVAALLLALLALLAYGSYVANGGFYSDDWANAAGYRFADSPRYLNAVADLEQILGGRPLLALMLPAPHALFGLDPAAHLALAAALGVLTALCLFVFLRTLEMPPLHAGGIAALALLFPWSDSLRLWPAASLNTVSACFFLVGLTITLRGLERPGRAGAAMHAAAAGFYLLSVLAYEATAAAALLAGLLYLGRAPRARALRCWLVDVAAVGAGLVYSLATTVSSRPVGSLSERIADLPEFGRESLLLLASALQPYGSMGRPLQALVLLVAAAVVAAAIWRVRNRDDDAIRVWLQWMLIGFLTVGAAYFMFLASNLHPLDPGIGNRINVVAGFGICLIVYTVLACAAQLIFASRAKAAALAGALALVVAVGYGIQLVDDQVDWEDAAERQLAVLDGMERELLPLPAGSTILAFGLPAQTAPGVPVFSRRWDLSGALELRSGTSLRGALPVYEGVEVSCGSRLAIDGGGGYGRFSLPYDRLFFYEPTKGRTRVESRRRCEALLRRFQAGPLEA